MRNSESHILAKSNIGLWTIELVAGKQPRMYADDTMTGLLGIKKSLSPEETYQVWLTNIDEGSIDLVTDAIKKMEAGEHAEVQYAWNHPDGYTMTVRGGGIRDKRYAGGIRLEGVHQNVSAVMHFDVRDKEASNDIISVFADEYEAVFLWDLSDGNFSVLSNKNEVAVQGGGNLQLGKAMKYYADNFIHPDDAGRLLEWVYDAEAAKDQLMIGQSQSVKYRSNADGDYHWYEAKFNRIKENHVLVGFKDCDEDVVDKLITDKLVNGYDALYIVDLDKNEVRSATRPSRGWTDDSLQDKGEYSQIALMIAESVSPQYRQDWVNFSDPDFLKRYFEKDDHREYLYELPGNEHTMRRVSFDVIERNHGVASKVILSFVGIDDISAKTMLLQRSIAEQSVFTGYFLKSYRAAYYVDLNTHEAKVYKRSNEWVSTSPDLMDFFLDIQKGVEIAAAPEEKAKLRKILTPEFIKKTMGDNPVFIHKFRDIMLGRDTFLQLEIVRGADEDHIAIGFKDITDEEVSRKTREKQLEDALAMAQEANNAKTRFLFNMSHDIRTPMNAITGFSTMARKSVNDQKKVIEYLDKIDISGQQLLMLINEVLEMSRIESGKIEFIDRPVNLQKRYTDMVTILAEQAHEFGIDFHHSLNDVQHYNIIADDVRIEQVVLNITGNAMKYTPKGGRIDLIVKEIPARKRGCASFILSVEDTGIGMSNEFQKHMFEPFSREKNTTVSKIQGTGLGLSIVKNLLDLADGDVAVTSELGKGTRFDITMDFRIDKNAPIAETTTRLIKKTDFKGKRALLVEDNELNREIAKFLLEENGLIVEEAEDGDIAVAKLQGIADIEEWDHYDFILMDIQMPRMNGYDATKAIRAIPTPLGVHFTIIAMTANAFEEDRQKALKSGMDDFVTKPINVDLLWETLAKYL